MEELQKYLEVIPPSDRLSQNLCIKLARLLILADQTGYLDLYDGERRRPVDDYRRAVAREFSSLRV